MEEVAEKLAQVSVVGFVVESQGATEIKIGGEFTWESFTKHFDWSRQLLFADSLILLLFGLGFQALPRQAAAVEVHQHVAERLQIIPTGLFDAKVCVDTRISGGTRQVFVFSVWDVGVGSGVAVFLGKAEINNKNLHIEHTQATAIHQCLKPTRAPKYQRQAAVLGGEDEHTPATPIVVNYTNEGSDRLNRIDPTLYKEAAKIKLPKLS